MKEHVSTEMKAFSEGMSAKLERVETEVNRRFESVERQLGLLTDAVRTHSKELHRIEEKLEDHDRRLSKIERAAE